MKPIDRLLSMMAVMALGMTPLVSLSQVDTLPINDREILGKDNISLDASESEKLIIAASRSTKSVDELPVTLYIISHDDIIQNGWVTLCDVLKTVPGIRVSQPHSGEFGEAFIQRGMMGNTYTKILINNVDIKPAVLTGMVLGANIPVRQAERIEIIYGPASASYGNDACGGVINIVTKDDIEKPFAMADIMAGTGQYHYVNFMAGGKFGRGKHVAQFSIYGSNLRYKDMNITDYDKDDIFNRWNFYEQRGDRFVYKDADGEHNISPKEITEDVLNNPQKLFQLQQYKEIVGYNAKWVGDLSYPEFCKIGQEAAQAGIEVKYRGLRITYNYLFRKDFSNLGHTPMLFGYSDPDNMMGERIIRAAAIGDWKFGRLTTNTVLKYVFYRMDQNSQRDVCYSNLRQYMYGAGDDIGFEENLTFEANDHLALSAGMSYQYSGLLPTTNESPNKFDFSSYKSFATKVDYTDPLFGDFGIYPHTYSTFGTYGQAVWDWKRFSFTGGIRYDYNTKWGASVNPRIAALVKITDRLTFRVSRGYAFKAPSAQQLNGVTAVNSGITYNNIMKMLGYPQVDTVLIAYQQMPVRTLEPENIASTEFGLRYYFNNQNNEYVEIVAYTNRIDDPIVRVWATLDTTKYHGIGSSAVSDDYPPTSRAYRNETNSQIKLVAYQLIAVKKDVIKSIHLDIEGGITITSGHEDISDDNYKGATFNRVDYIRQTPKFMGQFSFDFKFLKIMHLRVENIYCSKWARKYYIGNDNDMFWATPYYNLDCMLGMKFSKNLTGTLKVYNVFDAQYGGIDAKDMDVDLRYNPQLRRNFRICLSYSF